MANERISAQKRKYILTALCEGMAINSVCRMLSVGKNAVLRLIKETGEACEDWHDEHFVGLSIERVELDEQWNYVHTHKERLGLAEARDNPEKGDCWLFAALDPDSKAIITWRTGKRTGNAHPFIRDLAWRIVGEVQVTSDMLPAYPAAIGREFDGRAHYAQELKTFTPQKDLRPGEWLVQKTNPLVKVKRQRVYGNPDLHTSTVSHLERFWLTVRQGNKRCARKTLAYSKKWSNHAHASSIQIFVYNMCRKHESLPGTPAMALGITSRKWSMDDVVAMTEAYLQRQETAAFEAAFEAKFSPQPKRQIAPPIKIAPKHVAPASAPEDDSEPPEIWLLPRD